MRRSAPPPHPPPPSSSNPASKQAPRVLARPSVMGSAVGGGAPPFPSLGGVAVAEVGFDAAGGGHHQSLPASSSSSPPWIVLGRIAKFGGNVALTRSRAPWVSLLTISPDLLTEAIAYRDPKNPSILAVDTSGGILLLQVILRRASASEPNIVHLPGGHRSVLISGFIANYLVVDTTANTAYTLPEPGILEESGRIGIVYSSDAGAGAYVVAELQPIEDSANVRLVYFDSSTGQWARHRIPFPIRLPSSSFYPDCVLSHDGKLWWVDLSRGLVAWDALTKLCALSFFNLPPRKGFHCNRVEAPDLGRHRCVAVSDGKMCFVDMDSNNRDNDDMRKVSVWTLQADQDPTSANRWLLEYETSFDSIWSHKSYKSRRLPKRMPVLAFIHPSMPWTVYFFLDLRLFGIDLRGSNLVECVDYQPVAPLRDLISSRFFHVWDSSSGSTGGVTGSTGGVPEEFRQGNYPDKLFNAVYCQWKHQQGEIKISACSGQNGQTIACATKALENWNTTHSTSYEIDLTEPMDSNSFDKSQKFRTPLSHFHINFYGKSSGAEEKKQLFFAELNGKVGPENTLTVMPLGQDEDAVKDNSAEHICYCCSGLMHPRSKNFVGCEASTMHQHQ